MMSLHACVYLCMHIYIYIHTYIHTITYTDIYKCTHKHRMSAYASKFVAAARLYGHVVSAVYFMMSSLLQAVSDAAAIIIYPGPPRGLVTAPLAKDPLYP